MKKPSSSTSDTNSSKSIVKKDKSVPCPDCGKVYSSRTNMKKHQKKSCSSNNHTGNNSNSRNNTTTTNSKPKRGRPRVLESDSDTGSNNEGQNYDPTLSNDDEEDDKDNDSYTKLPSTNNTITVQASKRQKCTLVGASKPRPSSTTTITSRRLDRATKPESSTNQHFPTQNGGDMTYERMLNEPFQSCNITELLYVYDYYNYNKYKQTLIDEDMSQGRGQNYDSSSSNTNTTSTNNTSNTTNTTTTNMIVETAAEQWVDQGEEEGDACVHSRCMNPINNNTTSHTTVTTAVIRTVSTTVRTTGTATSATNNINTEITLTPPFLPPPQLHHKQAPLLHHNIALKCGLLCYIYYWSKPVLSHTQIEELGPYHIHYRMPHITVHTLFNMIDALPVSREEMYNIDTCKYMLEIPAEYEGFDVYTNNTTNTNSSSDSDNDNKENWGEKNRVEEVENEEVIMMENLRKGIILINQEYRHSLSLTLPDSPSSPALSNIAPTLPLVTTTNGTSRNGNGSNNSNTRGGSGSQKSSLYNTDVRILFAPIAATVGEEYVTIIKQYLDSRSALTFPAPIPSPTTTRPSTTPSLTTTHVTTPTTTTSTALALTTTTPALPTSSTNKGKMRFPTTLELAYQFESNKADWPEGLEGAIDGLKGYLGDREEGSLRLPLSFMDFTAFMQV